MKVSTNASQKPKRKSTTVTTVKRVSNGPTKVDIGSVQHANQKSSYSSAREHTGDPRYGKENPNNEDADYIKKARDRHQDIAYDKDGKTYRAGHTTTTTTPESKVPTKIDVPKLKLHVEEKKVYEKTAPKKPEKLKAMAMTYGTDSPTKGGGTKHVMKVRAR